MNWVNGYDNRFGSGSRPIESDPRLTCQVGEAGVHSIGRVGRTRETVGQA
jgi:hypothetical protein